MNCGLTLRELDWDTEFFGVSCAKAVLNRALGQPEWISLIEKGRQYDLLVIENRHSIPTNAQYIGRNTTAFLADVNIQFSKDIGGFHEMPLGVQIEQAMKPDDRVVSMAEFPYSRFLDDPELARRGGGEVYRKWVANAFGDPHKHFAIARTDSGEVSGFLLHSYSADICTVELICVSRQSIRSGVGTRLFRATEYSASQRGIAKIRVGTQIRNLEAINFYHAMGCRQSGCHQIYHLWNRQQIGLIW